LAPTVEVVPRGEHCGEQRILPLVAHFTPIVLPPPRGPTPGDHIMPLRGEIKNLTLLKKTNVLKFLEAVNETTYI
jgi:hypothetical protein